MLRSVILFAACFIFVASPVWASEAPPTGSPEKIGTTSGTQFEAGWNYFRVQTSDCGIGQILNEIQADGGGALTATEIWVWEQNSWKSYLPADTKKISQDTLVAFLANQKLFFDLDPAVCVRNDAARQAEIAKLRNPGAKNILDSLIEGVKNQINSLKNDLALLTARINLGSGEASPSAATVNIGNLNPAGDLVLNNNLGLYKNLNVLGKTTLNNLSVTGTMQAGLLNINGLSMTGDVTIDSLAGALKLQGGQVVIDKKGLVTLTTGHIAGNSTFRDAVILPTGLTAVTVPATWETAPTTITATPSYNARVWVENITPTGFVIKTDVASLKDEKIYWLAIW